MYLSKGCAIPASLPLSDPMYFNELRVAQKIQRKCEGADYAVNA